MPSQSAGLHLKNIHVVATMSVLGALSATTLLLCQPVTWQCSSQSQDAMTTVKTGEQSHVEGGHASNSKYCNHVHNSISCYSI